MSELILDLELVPQTCFYANLRTILSKSQWSILSKQIRDQVYNICEICGSDQQPLDCHEKWQYDDKKQIQKLIKMIALCKKCHGVKHFGFSQMQGKGKEAINHFMKINNLTKKQAEQHIEMCFELWAKRSKKKWIVDISYLSNYGIDIKKLKV